MRNLTSSSMGPWCFSIASCVLGALSGCVQNGYREDEVVCASGLTLQISIGKVVEAAKAAGMEIWKDKSSRNKFDEVFGSSLFLLNKRLALYIEPGEEVSVAKLVFVEDGAGRITKTYLSAITSIEKAAKSEGCSLSVVRESAGNSVAAE
jgi:hypothetical protein